MCWRSTLSRWRVHAKLVKLPFPLDQLRLLYLLIAWDAGSHGEEGQNTLVRRRHEALEVSGFAGGVAITAEFVTASEGGIEGLVREKVDTSALQLC